MQISNRATDLAKKQIESELVESPTNVVATSRALVEVATVQSKAEQMDAKALARMERIVRIQLENGTLPSTIKSALADISDLYARFGYSDGMFDIMEKFSEKGNLLTTINAGMRGILALNPKLELYGDLLDITNRQADESGALLTTIATGMERLIPYLNSSPNPEAIVKQVKEITSQDRLLLTTIVDRIIKEAHLPELGTAEVSSDRLLGR